MAIPSYAQGISVDTNVKAKNTVSSSGIKTSTANAVISFTDGDGNQRVVNNFTISSYGTAISYKLNGESNTHYLEPYETHEWDDFYVYQLVIVTNSAEYQYNGYMV